MSTRPLVAVVPTGLEQIAAREIRALGGGVGRTKHQPGRVRFEGPPDALFRANLALRTVDRVLVPVGEPQAAHKVELIEALKGLPFERHVAPGATVAVQVSTRRCRLYHSGLVEDAVREALIARGLGSGEGGGGVGAGRRDTGQGREESGITATIDIRGTDDRWEVCVDSSGRGLHKRGWRKATGKAPIRETLAAALLLQAGFTGAEPVLDPMCGAGTLPIEAATMAAGILPGAHRSFAFEGFPDLDRARWHELRDAARAVTAGVLPPIEGSDAAAGAVRAAVANARRAGVGDAIRFVKRRLEDLPEAAPDSRPGLLLFNPPYGNRVGETDEAEPAARWSEWGAVLRQRRPGWRVWLLAPSPALARAVGCRRAPALRLLNGGLRVGLYEVR